MADDVDRTTDRLVGEEAYLRKYARKPSGPIATGRCLYCDEIVGYETRWCTTECHSDYEVEAKLLARTVGARA